MEKPVFVVNPYVIALLVGESARYLPFSAGFFKGTGKSVHFSCLVDVIGAVDLYSIIIFVMFSDLVLVGYQFPIGAAP